ncbi:MAG: hypothetical protein QXR45_12360 [Candidatus Bathyarchaeia archaeon]
MRLYQARSFRLVKESTGQFSKSYVPAHLLSRYIVINGPEKVKAARASAQDAHTKQHQTTYKRLLLQWQ